jgi:protein-S-isoprenylcysteine O-methyltransferase Ste14
MDALNIITGIALLLSIIANSPTAKGGLKRAVQKYAVKPKTYLQKTPLNVSAVILILEILGVFQIGTLEYTNNLLYIRIGGLVLFILFGWLQVQAFKNLKNNYTQDVALNKNHQLVTKGIHKVIRHPQYISQVISDLGIGIALLGYLIIPLVLMVELPLFIMRAKKEEEIMQKFFGEKFTEYKKKSGFFLPYIG